MITITYHDNGRRREITVEGHAGYAEPGKDILCAAASMLVIALRDSMTESQVPYDETIGDGYAMIVCEDETAKPWYYMAMRGFLTLAEMYPKYYDVRTE